jgi:hypothetical protein
MTGGVMLVFVFVTNDVVMVVTGVNDGAMIVFGFMIADVLKLVNSMTVVSW